MSLLRGQTIRLLGSALLLFAAGAACSTAGTSDRPTAGTDAPINAPSVTALSSTNIAAEATGELFLSSQEGRPGEAIAVQGTGWVADRTVTIYLLTDDQTGAFVERDPESWVKLGDATPSDDGAFRSTILLMPAYVAANGTALALESGTTLYVTAEQHATHFTQSAAERLRIVDREEGS